jgi:hypothetical protein
VQKAKILSSTQKPVCDMATRRTARRTADPAPQEADQQGRPGQQQQDQQDHRQQQQQQGQQRRQQQHAENPPMPPQGDRSTFVALILWLFGGFMTGAHHFYLGRDTQGSHDPLSLCFGRRQIEKKH